MAKLECTSAYWDEDAKGKVIKSYDDMPENYTNPDGSRADDRRIYDVDEKDVDRLMASGCFKRV